MNSLSLLNVFKHNLYGEERGVKEEDSKKFGKLM